MKDKTVDSKGKFKDKMVCDVQTDRGLDDDEEAELGGVRSMFLLGALFLPATKSPSNDLV